MNNKSSILIVGGTGYLGRHLSKELESDGFDVSITGTKLIESEKFYSIDFEDESSFKYIKDLKFDIVVILASKLNALGISDLSHQDLYSNTISYANFLNFLVKNQITNKIVYTSSMTVYNPNNTSPVNENDSLNPVNTYGLSKQIAEMITSFCCEHNKIAGLTLRLPGIYGGDRKSGFIYNVAKKIKALEKVELNTKNLIYWETINVKDLCILIKEIINNYKWNSCYDVLNVCYGEETDMYKTVDFIKQLTNSSSEIVREKIKGYIPFYLSNAKLNKIISFNSSFKSSLINYIENI